MESAFQFSNPVLTNLEFKVNDEFSHLVNQEIQIKINMSVEIKRFDNSKEAVVALKFELGEQNKNNPFYIKATEQANFIWTEDLNEEDVNCLLNQNAPSLLLAYLRPIITQITSASPYDAYNIPFMNFTVNK